MKSLTCFRKKKEGFEVVSRIIKNLEKLIVGDMLKQSLTMLRIRLNEF